MSLGSPNLDRRQQALRAVRRHVRRLEIETHRVKAHLARLEADYEEDIADWMTRKLRRRAQPADQRLDPSHVDGVAGETNGDTVEFDRAKFVASGWANLEPALVDSKAVAPRDRRDVALEKAPHGSDKASPLPLIAANSDPSGWLAHLTNPTKKSAAYRKATPPLLVSFGIHAVGLLLCVTFTFATLIQQSIPLFASPNATDDDAPEELAEVEITSTKFEDAELQNVLSESDEFNIADNVSREVDAAQLGAGSQSLGDVGQLDTLPSELGTLMAGAGSPGSGKPGGELGDAVFFGARSKGDRFVFVVDNSSSMKGGRLETAIAELLKTIDALSARQGFYVIFVSDQTYPMFYPTPARELLPATASNKKQLAEWLPKAILASGNNRKLIEAMDMAASLRPHAVYLLWDGDMRYSEKVRLDVMTHLTRPNQWNFAIHTLGMGITSLDAEFHLTAIAKAHGGTFRRVDVPTNRGR